MGLTKKCNIRVVKYAIACRFAGTGETVSSFYFVLSKIASKAHHVSISLMEAEMFKKICDGI